MTISKNFGGLKNFHELRNLDINKDNIVGWIDVRKKEKKIDPHKLDTFFFSLFL